MAQVHNKATPYPSADSGESVLLAQQAADGDRNARARISEIAHPIIRYQTHRFCVRFCFENRYRYACTLDKPVGSPPSGSALCEWGNGSYGWMLDDLTNEKRLRKFRGDNGACLNDYLYHIANSLPFYERWKDWRFNRKVHVPTYIQDINPHAARVFLNLRSHDNLALIAQKLALSEENTENIAQLIILELTQRNKLHLLDPPKTVSLSDLKPHDDNDSDHTTQADIAVEGFDFESLQTNQHLYQAWNELNELEQYVIEAMVIENQEADDVLSAMRQLGVSFNKNPPEQLDRQQLYYFRRKTLAKLAKKMAR